MRVIVNPVFVELKLQHLTDRDSDDDDERKIWRFIKQQRSRPSPLRRLWENFLDTRFAMSRAAT